MRTTVSPAFNAGNPASLFEGRFSLGAGTLARNFDVSPDGERFLMIKQTGSEIDDGGSTQQLIAVFNWFEELKEMVPLP